VLGALEVVDDHGRVHAITSPSQRVVLAVLAAHAGEVVRIDQLVDAVWGDDPPPSARSSLRTYVSRLRRLLGDELVIHPTGYELRASVDARDVERAVVGAGEGDDGPSLADLDEALARWRGDPFAELDEVAALEAPRIRLRELALAARVRRARALLTAGRPAEAAVAAEEVVADDPWREGAWETLVDALAADHRQADALRASHRAAEALAEAGLEPGAGLRRAEAAVLAATSPTPGRRDLPAPTATLLGRADDLAAVDERLDRGRLVTLLGPGGVGKTRLALEVAHRRSGDHEWGARFVALESVEDPGDVAAAVLDGLGVAADGAPLDRRLAQAGGLDLLVVLDNCEHVLDAAAEVAATLCAGGPAIRVLATSRERLAVPGEQVWPVRPLPVTTAGRALLVERARATRPDVDLDDLALVDRVVDQLDGLPLAIEMAASHLATTTLADLADELDDRLGGLATRHRGTPERHRSLAGLVRWTTEGLVEADCILLAELSAFAGPIDAEAAAAVSAHPDPREGLRRLAEASLLAIEADGPGTAFTMLGPIRACAADLLATTGRDRDVAAAHARHHVAVARAADAALRTEQEAEAVVRLDRALPDLRAAHRWAVVEDPAVAVALSAALYLYGHTQIRLEVLGWAAELVDRPDAVAPDATEVDPDELAVVHGAAAQAAVLAGDLATARARAERGLAVPGARAGRWAPLEIASDVALFEGRLAEATSSLGRVPEGVDDPHLTMLILLGKVLPAAYAGDLERADALVGELQRCGARSPSDRAWVAYAEGEVVLDRDPPRALAALERAVALADEVGNRYVGGVARVSLCSLQARVGEPREAADRFVETLDHWRRQGATTHLVTTLRNLPLLLERLDAVEPAAELLGTLSAVDALPTWGVEAERLEGVRSRVGERLGDAAMAVATARGAGRALEDATLVARTELVGRLEG
jgi:predicted ATPase/DNA-binding SARP family transcriptional activator